MTINLKNVIPRIRLNFFFMGVLLGAWSTRIPELKTALDMSDQTLGKVLIGSACGALVSTRIIGKMIRELGTKKVFNLGTVVFPVGYFFIALSPNTFGVFIGLVFFVIGYFFLDNPLTIITQEIEAQSDRKYLSGFHAFWSIGTLSAAFFGSFLIGRVDYSLHLAGVAVLSFIVLFISGRALESKKPDNENIEKAPLPWIGPLGFAVIVAGLGMLASNSAEFGATDWSAIFLRDVLSITGQLYVGAYMAFEAGMILSRLLGDKYIHRYGPQKVIRVCGYFGSFLWLSCMLLSVNLNSSSKPISYVVILVGYFCAGCGVGPLFPAFLTYLGNVPGIEMGVALSRALFIALLGFAVVPALIGTISDATSLTFGMLLPIALLAVAGFISRFVRSEAKL